MSENPVSLMDQLDHVVALALDLRKVLQEQKEVLKESGFRLPPGTTTALQEIADQVDRVESQIEPLEHERDQYRALAHVAALINSSLDLTQVLNEVMDTIIDLTGAERGYLILRDDDTGDMDLRIGRNVDRETIASEGFEISRSIVDRVAASGEAIVTTNAQEDSRFSDAMSIVSYNLRSILCVPLTLKGEVTGVIYTDNKIHAGLFTEATRDLLLAFANQAAVAIDNARLFSRVTASLEAISEMKNLQDNVFASMASGVITTDDREQVTLINRRALQILDLETHDHIVGSDLRAVLPLLGSRFDSMVSQVLEADQHLTAAEFDTSLARRGSVNLSMNISPLKDAYENTQGVAIVLDDLTEIKRREAQMAGVRRYLPSEVVDEIRSPEELKLGGTRKVISILFADIRGFTTFSEQLGPEKLVEIVNAYMTIASDAIHGQQGVIDKFLGDAVMALYNTPLRPQEDHALRAVRSAWGILSEIQNHHSNQPESDHLRFGVGIHTGDAVVGNIGSTERLDYTAMGDAVNLAKRLQEAAMPMQILLSEATYQAVRDHVSVKELEPIQVRGRTQLTSVYELLEV